MRFLNLPKYYPAVSVIFILSLIASFFFWPENLGILAISILVLAFGLSLMLSILHNRKGYKQGQIVRAKVILNVTLEVLGLLLILFMASFAGYAVGVWAGTVVERSSSGLGMFAGFLTGFASAFVAGWGVSRAWRKIVKIQKQSKNGQRESNLSAGDF